MTLMLTKRDIEIQNSIQNETITQESYVEDLKAQILKDKLLVEYFTAIGDEIKKKTVMFRIECSEKELSGDMEE